MQIQIGPRVVNVLKGVVAVRGIIKTANSA